MSINFKIPFCLLDLFSPSFYFSQWTFWGGVGSWLVVAGNRLLRLYSLNYTSGGIDLDDLDPAQDTWQGGLVQVNIA